MADLAEAGLATADLTAALLAEVGQLREAMASRAAIEQAKGIVMAGQRCDAGAAFAILTELSQTTNTKLRTVATELIADTTAPAAPHIPA